MNLKLYFGISTLVAFTAQAQVTIAPMTTFSPDHDGWWAPGEGGQTYLGTGGLERGITFNPATGHLLLASRNGGNVIRILDGSTGADLGAMNTAGISGGTYAINMIGAANDGAIYLGNLTTASGTTAFKLYRYANEGATATVAYSGAAGLAARVGDTLSVFGSGSATRVAVGYGSGSLGYGIIDPTAGTAVGVTSWGAPPNPGTGDFRLGIAMASDTEVWGSQGSPGARYTTFSGDKGTLQGTLTPFSVSERLMDYTVLNGHALLAMQSTGDSHVSIYDVTNPLNPVNVGYGLNIPNGTSLTANANASGDVVWGNAIDNGDGTWSQPLYAMSSNQGIQAFIVTVPEPSSLALLALGALAFLRRGGK